MQSMVEAATCPPPGSTDVVVEIDAIGDSGALYRLELVVERLADERFVISGKIHDNNPYNFALLEERIEFAIDRER